MKYGDVLTHKRSIDAFRYDPLSVMVIDWKTVPPYHVTMGWSVVILDAQGDWLTHTDWRRVGHIHYVHRSDLSRWHVE